MEKATKIPLFRRCVIQNFPFIEEDFDALTDYGLLCKVVEYLNKVIEQTNATSTQVEELSVAFNTLKDYVDHYFDNLDVQEEINNKLDEMVEDGTLEEIIGHYIQSPATEDTLGTIKVGSGLQMDSTDHLNVIESEDYIDCQNLSYDYTAENTDTTTKVKIHYTIIPSTYKPMLAVSDPTNPSARKSASDINARVKASVMINAGTWNEDTGVVDGILIDNHEIIAPAPIPQHSNRQYLTITDDGTLGSVANTTTGEALIEAGYKYVIPGFYVLYANGTDMSITHDPDGLEPRTFIAQKANGDYLVGVCSGRGADENTGMSYINIIDFLFNKINFNPTFVYALDGGRSAQLMYRGIRQNALTQAQDRACPNWLYFANPKAKNQGIFDSQSANNEQIVANEIKSKRVQDYDDVKLTSMLLPEGVTVSQNSYARNINGTLMDIHIRFVVGTGVSLPTYTDLITGFPKTYRPGMRYLAYKLVSDNFDSYKTFYTVHDDTKNVLTIRCRQALTEGEYTIHMTYPIAF